MLGGCTSTGSTIRYPKSHYVQLYVPYSCTGTGTVSNRHTVNIQLYCTGTCSYSTRTVLYSFSSPWFEWWLLLQPCCAAAGANRAKRRARNDAGARRSAAQRRRSLGHRHVRGAPQLIYRRAASLPVRASCPHSRTRLLWPQDGGKALANWHSIATTDRWALIICVWG